MLSEISDYTFGSQDALEPARQNIFSKKTIANREVQQKGKTSEKAATPSLLSFQV